MGLMDLFRGRPSGRLSHLVGRIADDPQVVVEEGTRYMVFCLVEVPETTFKVKMLPTTPKRRKGDRVELTYRSSSGGIAEVETLYAAPDSGFARRRDGDDAGSARTT